MSVTSQRDSTSVAIVLIYLMQIDIYSGGPITHWEPSWRRYRRISSICPTNMSRVCFERVTSLLLIALDADEEVLITLGYRQDFKRKFTVWSSFCVSFSVLGLLPSVAATLAYSLGYEASADFLIQISWYRRNGLGMDYCQYHDSIRRRLHGRTLF